MSCCGGSPGYQELDEVSRLVAGKLAAFLKTLRNNGFAVGLQEGQDAASLMAAGYAEKPGLLRSALKHLFSARKSDWERFDGIFELMCGYTNGEPGLPPQVLAELKKLA